MLTIAIDRVDTRYRIPASARREQARLQHIVRDGLTRTLEGAVSREGIAPGQHICIDAVRVLTTLRLREPDSTLASTIGEAVAAAIRRLLDEGSASVVRYTTRGHALIDLTASVMAGDFSRAWAWAQMGLWRSDFRLRPHDAAERILHRLALEPTLIVAVLSHVARHHRARLDDLLAHGSPRAWAAAATAAWRAAGAEMNLPDQTSARADRHAAAPVHDRRVTGVAERIVARSALLADARSAIAQLPRETFTALVGLAVLEAAPSAPRSGIDVSQVAAVVARIVAPRAATRERISEPTTERISNVNPLPADVVESHGGERVEPVEGEAATAPGPSFHEVAAAIPADRAIDSAADATPAPGVLAVRLTAPTHHGGLLYLVNVLRRMNVIDRLAQDTPWSDRGLRWLLHQLAMLLAPVSPDDPAALAFAGLPPDAESPSSLQAAPTADEVAALAQLSDAVSQALLDHLRASGGSVTADAAAVLDLVCRRDADVVADPGWIEVHFDADTVSLDVRRAGLDVNPEWVPWLGVVLRFVYA
jgi:hypothetical protein